MPAKARFCPACGQAVTSSPIAAPASFPGERKQVTVLFADFAGFTAFAYTRDAEEVRDYMQSIWARLDAVIAAHGGRTEKHIGDAVMAVFGAQHAREEDPVQAVRAALAMQSSLTELSTGSADAHSDDLPVLSSPLQLRVGVHTGLVVVGRPGAEGELGISGDTVNLASRLEHTAPVGGVLISHDTYRHVYGLFDVRTLPPIAVRGRPEPVQTYLVVTAKPRAVAVQLRGVEGVPTEMIGREVELKSLQSLLQTVFEKKESRAVTVVGDAGIGKSCLLREFLRWSEPLPQKVRLFTGRATAQTAGLPFSLMRDVFSSRFEILESDSSAVARQKLEAGLSKLVADEPSTIFSTTAFIGQLLGWDFSDSSELRGVLNDPDEFRHRAFQCFSQFFSQVAHRNNAPGESPRHGVLLVIEDVHWSDDGSLDLLEHLSRTCEQVPLLVICLARPTLFERRAAWGENLPGHFRMELAPLSRRESLTMVETILRKTPQLPQALLELIVAGAEGIPFYIEEIIKMLIDQKVIVPGPDLWRIEPEKLAAARVPPTLTGVLQARLDGLAPAERAVLQRASVVGRVFWDTAVEALAPELSAATDPNKRNEYPAGDSPHSTGLNAQLSDILSSLRRKELIFRRQSSAFAGAVEYIFKHELLRNVTYESLLKKSRREYHAHVASWLIENSGERIGEYTGLVASHLEQAGQSAEAADWYGRAGQQARSGYAPATAIEHFRKALELAPIQPPSSGVARRAESDNLQPSTSASLHLEWLEGLGETLAARAAFAEAMEVYAKMNALAGSLGNVVAQARAQNGFAFLHERSGDFRASIAAAERAEVLARGANRAGLEERIKALHLKGWAFFRVGDATAVLELADQTLKLCTESNDRHGMAASYKLYGVAHLQMAHYDEAQKFFQQGLALCEAFGDRRNAAAMWSNLGETARLRGDCNGATELYQKALTIAHETGNRYCEAIYLNNLGGARLGLNQFSEAETALREVIAQTGSRKLHIISETYSFLSTACLGQGKFAEALSAARQALVLSKQFGGHLDLGQAWRALALALAKTKESDRGAGSGARADDAPTEPLVCFEESLRVFRGMKAEGEEARTLLAWAELEREQGRCEQAAQKAKEACAIFTRLSMAAETNRAESFLSQLAG